jgi:hypothetical protein
LAYCSVSLFRYLAQLQHIAHLNLYNITLKGALLDALCAHRPPRVTTLSLRCCGLELAAVQAMCASDTLLVADVPYENHGCSELTYEFKDFQQPKAAE